MTTKVKPIPQGYHTVTPFISLENAAKAIEFYKKAFGAKLIESHQMEGKIMHAVIQIGDSFLMLADEFPESGCGMVSPSKLNHVTASIHLYVEDADAIFNQAIENGATVNMPISDVFWGDRYGQVKDPFGHIWSIATHKQDLSPQQVEDAAQEFMSQKK